MSEQCRMCDGEVRMIAYRGTGLCSGGCADREVARIALDRAERARLDSLNSRMRVDWRAD